MTRIIKTHYEVLGVTQEATAGEIDDAYDALEHQIYAEAIANVKPRTGLRKLTDRWVEMRRGIRHEAIWYSHSVLINFERRLAYDKTLKAYETERFKTDSRVLQTAVRVLIGTIAVGAFAFAWNALLHPQVAAYLIEERINAQAAYPLPALIISVFAVLVLIALIQRYVARKRWGEWKGTPAYRELGYQLRKLTILLIFAYLVVHTLVMQAVYVMLI